MENSLYEIDCVRRDIIDNNLQVKAIIQDINGCEGPLPTLQELNNVGRKKIAALRKHIQRLDDLAGEIDEPELSNEVDIHRRQLTSTLNLFRKAHVAAMLKIENADKNNLLGTDDGVRRRPQNAGKAGLLKISSNVTEQLLSVSRQLADTTNSSADTLNILSNTSSTVQDTNQELLTTQSTIGQSGKLLAKYGRREFTDKILIFFAFSFFLAAVLYIVSKRLW